ncbi:MAG: TOBE domain-containing protein [Betaproteobacteria bacterium]|nr:TOBE domain-containing protein [Betaproteobacteria bacterium]
MNFVSGRVQGPTGVQCASMLLACAAGAHPVGSAVRCGFRPEDVTRVAGPASDAGLLARLLSVEPLGAFVRLHCEVPALGVTPIRVDMRRSSFAEQPLEPGQALALHIDPAAVHLFPEGDRA